MKWIYISVNILLAYPMFSQNTFSKVYDIDENALRNQLNDFEVVKDKIYTYSTLFCDLENSVDATCVALTKFNIEGSILSKAIMDTLNASEFCFEGLCYYDDTIVMSTYVKGEKFEKVSILHFDAGLQQIQLSKLSEKNSTSQVENMGIEYIEDDLYYFGNLNNMSTIPDSAQIIKTDLEGNELARFYYSYGNSSLDINNLQATADGNLAFILQIKSPSGANNGFNGYQLMKIDTAGIVLDTLTFRDGDTQPNRVLATSDGGYIFSSRRHPFEYFDSAPPGRIHKMDSNMDTLEWSLIMPNNQLVDGRHYRMWDYLETKNGDIVACGMAYDNTDTQLATGVPDRNSTWNGFIVRLSPEGEIKWLRLYKNDNDLLPHDEYGRFRPSRLNKIKELPDGRFVAAGDVFVNNRQISGINEQETEAFHLWLLMVDADGCLEGSDCSEIIRLGESNSSLNYDVGTKWTYESKNLPISLVKFQEYEIVDSVFWKGADAFVVEPGIVSNQDYMIRENDKVYFWDDALGEYQLNYDYETNEDYHIRYFNTNSGVIDSVLVKVDSVGVENINGINHDIQYCSSTLGVGNLERPFQVINGIGNSFGGLRLPIGFVVDNITNDLGRVRCFENESLFYTFTEVACDSTWFTTTTEEQIAIETNIYPNPFSNHLTIEIEDGYNMILEISDLLGKVYLSKSIDKSSTINTSMWSNGIYIATLRSKGHLVKQDKLVLAR